jgi:hypothetical protein
MKGEGKTFPKMGSSRVKMRKVIHGWENEVTPIVLKSCKNMQNGVKKSIWHIT